MRIEPCTIKDAFLAGLVFLLATPAGAEMKDNGEAPPVAVADIMRAWKEREQRTTTLRFRWTESRARADRDASPADQSALKPTDEPQSPVDSVVKTQRELILDGELWRCNTEGPEFLLNEGRYIPSSSVAVWNGHTRIQYVRVDTRAKSGSVKSANDGLGWLLDLAPLSLTYRPFAWQMVVPPQARFVIGRNRGVINGHSCLILKQFQGQRSREFWIDPKRDFSILRFLKNHRGKPILNADISYKQDSQHGWVPTSWRIVTFGGGGERVVNASEGMVSEYAINQQIDPKDFQFEFPVDTWVMDEIAKNEYIVRGRAEKRIVLREELERGAKYPDLLATETGEAGLPPKGNTRTITTVVIVLAALIGGALAARGVILRLRT